MHSAWEGDVPKWYSMVEMSHWFDRISFERKQIRKYLHLFKYILHVCPDIRLLLYGTTKLVDLIDVAGNPVVVHCSDGWDRTAQVSMG